MAVKITHSPGYPQFGLAKAVQAARKIFDADRRNPVDRAVAVRHMGYSGPSGAADKAIATLAHYGLVERAGKGDVRVTQLAVDIIHPETPDAGKAALLEAGFNPQVFQDIRDRFGDHVSAQTLESYLVRSNFLQRAIGPVIKSYLETRSFLEQSEAFESGGSDPETSADSSLPKPDETVFGGANVGDFVQWEIDGVLQMEKPMRVRLVTDDGWVAVEGSETGIPMSQVIVEERAVSAIPPIEAPRFKLAPEQEDVAKPGTRKAMFPLDEGDVTLIFPEGLSKDALADLSQYLDIFLKKEGRKTGNKVAADGANNV